MPARPKSLSKSWLAARAQVSDRTLSDYNLRLKPEGETRRHASVTLVIYVPITHIA